MGNSDAFLLDRERRRARSRHRATSRPARVGARAALAGCTSTTCARSEPTVERRGRRSSACSASTERPADYDEVVLPEDPPDPFAGTGADVLAGGHVHVPQLSPGRRRPSTSTPAASAAATTTAEPDDDFRFDPWASYAIVDGGSVEFHTRAVRPRRARPRSRARARDAACRRKCSSRYRRS